MNNKTPHEMAVDEAIREIDSTAVTITQRAKLILVRASQMKFPTAERSTAAAASIRQFARVSLECARQYSVDSFERQAASFASELRELSKPIPTPSFAENLSGHAAQLNKIGWLSVEIDALSSYAQGGAGGTDRITSYDVNTVTFASGWTVNRSEIRDGLRPSWQPVDEYRESAQYQQMLQAHATSVAVERQRQDAETPRISAGPAREIGRRA